MRKMIDSGEKNPAKKIIVRPCAVGHWGSAMEKPKTLGDIQLEQFLRELETHAGRKRIGDDTYKEAKAAERRKSICPPTK